MPYNHAFWKAFHSLTHPLSLLAIMFLLFNDHWLRYAHPSWLTGKLGDFMWLVFAPFIAGLVFAWIIPRRLERHTDIVGGLSIGFIGVWFATAKIIPFVHHLTTETLYAIVGWEGQLRLDVTDLLTLPALIISAYIWQKASDDKVSLKPFAYVALGLGLLGTLATSPPHIVPDYGLRAICYTDIYNFLYTSTLFGAEYPNGPGHKEYKSLDGGLSWQPTEISDLEKCDTPSQLTGTELQIRWSPAETVETSHDGVNWITEYDLFEIRKEIRSVLRHSRKCLFNCNSNAVNDDPGPFDATFDPESGNIIFAMGWDGVLVRTSAGIYEWVNVGGYGLEPLHGWDSVEQGLFLELWLALATAFLVVTTSTAYIRQNAGRWSTSFLACGWIGYALILIVLVAEITETKSHSLPTVTAIMSLVCFVFIAIPLSLGAMWDILRNFRSVALNIALVAIGSGMLFIFPFLLWTQGRIPRYVTAYAFSIILTAFGLYASWLYLKRILPTLEPEKLKNDAVEKDKKSTE